MLVPQRLLALVLGLLLLPGAHAQTVLQFGGGEGYTPAAQCLTAPERAAIADRLDRAAEALRAQGRLGVTKSSVALDVPMRATPTLETNGFYGISNFVDQDTAAPNSIEDYNCGARTYDTNSGYNHQGVDYFSFPYGWTLMDEDQVEVVAAAPGTILDKDDGNQDRSCSFNGTAWNAVYVRHDDGSTAWYGHLKRGSLTSKDVGERVEAGEFLGVVGSSGNSTGPHLHFELYDADDNLVEPYAGPCNGLNSESWWAEQRPYYEPQVVALMTHGTVPDPFPSCPVVTDDPARKDDFEDGDRLFLASYFRDQLDTQTAAFELINPSGAVTSEWDLQINDPHYAASYWYWTFDITAAWMRGVWTWRVTFEGETLEHRFGVGVSVAAEDAAPRRASLSEAYPNPTAATARWTLRLDAPQHVRAALYDVLGRRVATLHEGALPAGEATLDVTGALAAGPYVLRVTGDTFAATRRLVVTR